MNTKKTQERIELEKRIQEKEWFKLLPKYTQRSLLDQPDEYLALLLKQENMVVTTGEEIGCGFGYNTEKKPVIRMPVFSASVIGASKLNKLKIYPIDKARAILENVKLLEKPLSDKKKKLIAKILKKIGDKDLWDLGALIEEKTRQLQLEMETGRDKSPYLPGLALDREKEAETSVITLGNYLWLWQWINLNSKTAKFHRSVSPIFYSEAVRTYDETPQRLYQIECGCGKMTSVYAIGPFSALKLASSFPKDDPERYRFWDHKYGCRTTADEFCYCWSTMLVRERLERLKTPELLDELCPVCNGEGNDAAASHEHELRTNVTVGFKCPACKGIGKVTGDEKDRIMFREALESVRSGKSNRGILFSLLLHLAKNKRDEVFDWSKARDYYVEKIEPQTRLIAIPVPGKVLVVTQETVRLEDVYCSGDRFPDKETELTPLILEISNIEDIQEPGKIEFRKEAQAFIKGEKIRSVQPGEDQSAKEAAKIRRESPGLNGRIEVQKMSYNPNYAVYTFPGKVFNVDIYDLSKGSPTRLISKIDSERQELIQGILNIPGVTCVFLEPASISVIKAKTFSWEDIEPRLRALFEEHKLGDTSLLRKDILPEKAPEVVAGDEEENGTKKEYHTTALLTISSIENFYQQFWEQMNVRHNREKTIKTIGRRGYEILDLVFRNELTNEVFIQPYRFTVRKNKNASWADVDSMVMSAIIKCAEKYKASE